MDFDGQTGTDLRTQLETTLARNKVLEADNHNLKVEKVLSTSNFELVTSDDLQGVPLDKVEEKAKEIEESKRATQDSLIRKGLEARGWDAEEIDTFISGQTPEPKVNEDEQAHSRLRRLQSLDAQPVRPANPADGAEPGLPTILAHFQQESRAQDRSKGRRS